MVIVLKRNYVLFSRLFSELQQSVSVSLWAWKVCRIPYNCQGNVSLQISLRLESVTLKLEQVACTCIFVFCFSDKLQNNCVKITACSFDIAYNDH